MKWCDVVWSITTKSAKLVGDCPCHLQMHDAITNLCHSLSIPKLLYVLHTSYAFPHHYWNSGTTLWWPSFPGLPTSTSSRKTHLGHKQLSQVPWVALVSGVPPITDGLFGICWWNLWSYTSAPTHAVVSCPILWQEPWLVYMIACLTYEHTLTYGHESVEVVEPADSLSPIGLPICSLHESAVSIMHIRRLL